MPLRDFRCLHCGTTAEHLLKHSDPDPNICTHCGQLGLERVLTASSFHLKGDGWFDRRGSNTSRSS